MAKHISLGRNKRKSFGAMKFNKICIIHLNQIGDLAFSLPLLKALRENFPNASIHSVIKPYLQELLDCSAYVDRIIPRESGLSAKQKLFKHIRGNRYDLLISLSRSEECLMLAALSKAAVKAGFPHFPWSLFFDIKEKTEGHNSWYNNAKLLKQLNIKVVKNDYVGLIKAEENPFNISLPEKFVIISPGASKKRFAKTWEEEKFAELILLLKEKYDLSPVLVGGKDNQESNSMIRNIAKEKTRGSDIDILNLTGTIGLQALCSVLKHARLFVGIDSGVMHLASALDVPVVGLFGPTDPYYVGPQNKKSVVVRKEEMQCLPCYLKDCKHRDCMKKLEVSKVMQACEHLLSKIDS
jgi:lipopolysaccharide heptosyltransferase II